MKLTIMVEEGRHRIMTTGYTEIKWRCHRCKSIIELPQQQLFYYCYICGAKVIKKVGGKEEI